jgi:hypothetical protein
MFPDEGGIGELQVSNICNSLDIEKYTWNPNLLPLLYL